MKKILYILLAAFLSVSALTSCTKEEVKPQGADVGLGKIKE
jgi:hypothetical protein